MAAGDVTFSQANEDGTDCVVPCCACSKSVYGEEFVFDLSGIVTCGCTEQFGNPGSFYSLDLPDGYPSEVTLTYGGGNQWASDFLDVTYTVYNGGGDPECPDPDTVTGALFQVIATCDENTESEHFGELKILVIIVGLFTIYEGYFTALGGTAPNVNVCGQPTTGPLAFMALMFDGNGEISAPP